jgi:hypothetical protein
MGTCSPSPLASELQSAAQRFLRIASRCSGIRRAAPCPFGGHPSVAPDVVVRRQWNRPESPEGRLIVRLVSWIVVVASCRTREWPLGKWGEAVSRETTGIRRALTYQALQRLRRLGHGSLALPATHPQAVLGPVQPAPHRGPRHPGAHGNLPSRDAEALDAPQDVQPRRQRVGLPDVGGLQAPLRTGEPLTQELGGVPERQRNRRQPRYARPPPISTPHLVLV